MLRVPRIGSRERAHRALLGKKVKFLKLFSPWLLITETLANKIWTRGTGDHDPAVLLGGTTTLDDLGNYLVQDETA